jgi:chromosomal replication initiator protein
MGESISELNHIWSKVLENLEQKIDDRRFFDVFLSGSKIYSFEGSSMIISAGTSLAVNILSTKFLQDITTAVKEVTGKNVNITFELADNLKEKVQVVEEAKYFKYSQVNESLTFDNFVTGPCNIEAKQAALLIAQNPGFRDYNPLFIYSDSGLGKTHLLSAIVNYIREYGKGKSALYCSATDFLEEYLMAASGEREADKLKNYIVRHDILLIDDVQMLGGKEKTTDFLFQIFQKMHNTNKQIVITSDKHPSELKGFDERLKSRFGGGLSISIASPDVQTCVSILKAKIEAGPLDINIFDQDVLDFIGQKFSKNIRNIDEALHKLVYYTTVFKPGKHIDMEIAMEALQPLVDVRSEKQKLSEQRIINVVADYYSLTPSQVTGSSREYKIALARHVSMYLIRTLLDTPFTRIGAMFGGKDHSTVMSGVEKVERELKTNSNLQEAVNELKKRLK